MPFLKNFRILPVLILTAFLAFSVRLADVVMGVSQLSGSAHAQQEVNIEPPSMPGLMNTRDEGEESGVEKITPPAGTQAEPAQKMSPALIFADEDEKETEKEAGEEQAAESTEEHKEAPAEEHKEGEAGTDAAAEAEAPWKDAGDSDLDFTAVRMELYEDLVARRKELDKRESDVVAKEALLQAAEKEIDRKYEEMQKLRAELEGLLKQQSEEEDARVASLVKIYENMKPKDAARIFDTLDIDVLVSVMGKMSERKLSPVLAAMNPERARTITIMLAEQKQLPELPQSN